MSRLVSYCVGLSFIVFWAASARADEQAEWDKRYREAIESCIMTSMKKTACIHVTDGNPLSHGPTALEKAFEASYNSITWGVGRVAIGISAGRALVDEQNAPYWKRLNSEYNYEILKKWAQYRAKKDNLESCQKACLATCISSRMLEYDDRNLLTHWTEGLGREKGVCREFSGMATDLMRSMGLKANIVIGTVYSINNGQTPKKEGGHAMVQVALPSGAFTMEPQSDSCEFYDSKFSRGVRTLGAETLNVNAL